MKAGISEMGSEMSWEETAPMRRMASGMVSRICQNEYVDTPNRTGRSGAGSTCPATAGAGVAARAAVTTAVEARK